MNLLLFTGTVKGALSDDCDFEVSTDGGATFSPAIRALAGPAAITIADGPLDLIVRATPKPSTNCWPLEGTFRVEPPIVASTSAPAEFASPNAAFTPLGGTISFVVHFSQVRDVTEAARVGLTPVPLPPPAAGDFRGPFAKPLPPAAWSPLAALSGVNFVGSPLIQGGKIAADPQPLTIRPFGTALVLQWHDSNAGGARSPDTIAVYWPDAVAREPGASSTPFLVYFHPTAAQNAGPPDLIYTNPLGGPSPFGFDFVFFGQWRYMNYIGDPLKGGDNPFWKGLPYQVQESGKSAVIVMPLNRVASTCKEIERFASAALVEELLLEIQAFMLRRADNFDRPGIGHLAFASFSSGHATMTCFLSDATCRTHRLYLDTLQEIVYFDPHADDETVTAGAIGQAVFWGTKGTSATKIVRLYTQHSPTQLAAIAASMGVTVPAPPSVGASATNRRSIACLPTSSWNAFATSVLGTSTTFTGGAVHQLISSMMLTDALRQSDF
jgi:hypothetical protein